MFDVNDVKLLEGQGILTHCLGYIKHEDDYLLSYFQFSYWVKQKCVTFKATPIIGEGGCYRITYMDNLVCENTHVSKLAEAMDERIPILLTSKKFVQDIGRMGAF